MGRCPGVLGLGEQGGLMQKRYLCLQGCIFLLSGAIYCARDAASVAEMPAAA